MSQTPLFDSLKEYSERTNGYFRIPGHRFERGIPAPFTDFAGSKIFKIDVTETPAADDLHNPENVIADSQRYTAEAFGAEKSFYLVNGTTCGNQSMIMAAAGEGCNGRPDKILVPRNVHKSVMAGLIISGARPVYMPVDYIEEFGIMGKLDSETVKRKLQKHPDSKAVFAVSPTYHGICSDIESLSVSAHGYDIPLLVDEAHGAHLYFCRNLPAGALSLGADACAQSLHKTAGALTQSSLLHLGRRAVQSGRINVHRIDSALRMTMSTSPSYILLTSLELARNDLQLHGEEYLNRTIELAGKIRIKTNDIPGFRCPDRETLKNCRAFDADPTRLVINCDNAGISGYELKDLLWGKFGIDIEMADSRNILLLLSYGNTDDEAKIFIDALEKISKILPISRLPSSMPAKATGTEATGRLPEIPEMALTPRQAYYSETRCIRWEEMTGKIAAEPAAPYPPGIPVVYPGEIITEEICSYLDQVKKEGRHLHGISDKSLETIRICDV